jgi:tRNA/rRNA methyltransferase
VLHAWHGLQPGAGARPTPESPEPSRRGPLEALLADAEALLLEVGFLYPHTAQARMAKIRTLLQRGQVSGEAVALLRGMVRQLRWASLRGANPGGGSGPDPS